MQPESCEVDEMILDRAAGMSPARAIGAAVLAVPIGSCAAEVGSDAWCKEMDVKPEGERSANDAADYARHCVLRLARDG
jgi:hypothetical protein